MKIHIVGDGVVGHATGVGLARFGHQVMYTDKGDDHAAVEADVHFVCTPEAVAPDVVRMLAAKEPYRSKSSGTVPPREPAAWKDIIVIRSSVPPGTTEALSQELGRPLYHMPEFLKEATAQQDFLHSSRIIMGGSHNSSNRVDSLYLAALFRDMRLEPFFCHSTESEMVKVLTNAYLAMLISFWSDTAPLCKAAGINSHKVARLVALDPRVVSYGAFQHGVAYGGKCLHKDVQQVLDLAKKYALDMPMLYATQLVNKRLGGE